MSQVYWILFAQHGLKKLKILQRMYELKNAFATQRFCSFERQFPPEYYTQRATNFTMFKFH